MDYYKVLGLESSATVDDVKQAYRKLAMKHHPDRGGDESKFKEIKEAYEQLTSPTSNGSKYNDLHEFFRRGQREGRNNWNFNSEWDNEPVKNSDVHISIICTLEEAHTGFTKQIDVTLPDGTTKHMQVMFPSGCTSDIKIRYAGQGGQVIPSRAAGDLYVKLNITSHPIWRTQGIELFATLQISVWQAMFGATVEITDIGGSTMEVTVPAGTQSRSQLRLKGKGFNIRGSTLRSNAYLEIVVIIPTLTTEDYYKTIIDLQEKL